MIPFDAKKLQAQKEKAIETTATEVSETKPALENKEASETKNKKDKNYIFFHKNKGLFLEIKKLSNFALNSHFTNFNSMS